MMNGVPGIIFKQAYGYLLNINVFHFYYTTAARRVILLHRARCSRGGTQSTHNSQQGAQSYHKVFVSWPLIMSQMFYSRTYAAFTITVLSVA